VRADDRDERDPREPQPAPDAPGTIPAAEDATPEEILRREIVRKARHDWIRLSRLMQEERDRTREREPEEPEEPAPPGD